MALLIEELEQKNPAHLSWIFCIYNYSTVTDLAKFLGLSTSRPLFLAM